MAVSEEAQADFLARQGCETGQGFLFGRPQEMVKALPSDRLHNTPA